MIDLLKQSVLIQALLAVMSVGTMVYLYIVGRPVPDELVTVVMLILGFYFGTKSQNLINRRL